MSKLFIRLTVLFVAIYMVVCHIAAVVWQINLWSHTYTVLFEICVCLCITAQGKYHCKFIRWTAYAITLNDALLSADEMFDFIPYSLIIVLPIIIITIGLLTTTTLALRHYHRVRKLKRQWEKTRKPSRQYYKK
jgi:ABC-type Na+ efflux pump permease subunit